MGQVYEDVHLMWANKIGVDDQKALYGQRISFCAVQLYGPITNLAPPTDRWTDY